MKQHVVGWQVGLSGVVLFTRNDNIILGIGGLQPGGPNCFWRVERPSLDTYYRVDRRNFRPFIRCPHGWSNGWWSLPVVGRFEHEKQRTVQALLGAEARLDPQSEGTWRSVVDRLHAEIHVRQRTFLQPILCGSHATNTSEALCWETNTEQSKRNKPRSRGGGKCFIRSEALAWLTVPDRGASFHEQPVCDVEEGSCVRKCFRSSWLGLVGLGRQGKACSIACRAISEVCTAGVCR